MKRNFNGKALQEVVEASPYSITEFASALGISRKYLYDIFKGDAVPGTLIFDRIRQLLPDVPYDDFFCQGSIQSCTEQPEVA